MKCQGVNILKTFMYPNTRSKFLRLLQSAGKIPVLSSDEIANSLQFWSRIREFDGSACNTAIVI